MHIPIAFYVSEIPNYYCCGNCDRVLFVGLLIAIVSLLYKLTVNCCQLCKLSLFDCAILFWVISGVRFIRKETGSKWRQVYVVSMLKFVCLRILNIVCTEASENILEKRLHLYTYSDTICMVWDTTDQHGWLYSRVWFTCISQFRKDMCNKQDELM